ncbi:hypothetical protein KAI87_10045 [Myxococcota bacterium]|nr:hypothetical protein [Myxococcota bacterium]
MVSMNTDLSAKFPMLNVNHEGDGQYGISNESSAQGGTSAEATTSNKVVSEQEVNTMLAASGIQAKGGEYTAADGFAITTSNVAAATSFNGAPALPEVAGSSSSSSSMSSVDGATGVFAFDHAAMETSSLMWMALSTMAHTGMQDMKDATDIKHLMQKSKNEMGKAKIASKESEIEAQREAATEAFVTAVVAAVVSFAVGYAAAPAAGATQSAAQAGATAAAGAIGGVINAAGNMASQNGGAQAKVNEEQLKQMHYEMMEGMADGAIQDAQANYEGAKESFKLALKIMTEHVERQTQISGTITRS